MYNNKALYKLKKNKYKKMIVKRIIIKIFVEKHLQ
jgi:hypothetical protein